MKLKTNNFIIGIILSVIICGLIIYAAEINASVLQIVIGFIVFIFPSVFMTSLQSKSSIFLITSTIILLSYISFKYHYYDIWIGVLIALIIGRTINYYKIKN